MKKWVIISLSPALLVLFVGYLRNFLTTILGYTVGGTIGDLIGLISPVLCIIMIYLC